jgi:NAD(P)-dependent dehydrogenase (short-subunit alcohol dehydrogenase family)
MGKLDGQVVIVTGASSGMGWEAVQQFAAEGAKVVAAARREGPLKELIQIVTANGAEAITCATDISKRDDVDKLVQATVDRFGRLDVMCNIAGINAPYREMAVLTQEKWDRILATNLTGAFHCTQAVLPQMRQQGGGTIIHVSSVSGKWGDTSGAAYQAAKHGMAGLAYGTMFEERKNGIRISMIYPGLCDTPILKNRVVPVPRETLDKAMRPEDIAAACVFCASLPLRTYISDLVIMPGGLQCVGHAAI